MFAQPNETQSLVLNCIVLIVSCAEEGVPSLAIMIW